jgi:dethiobiotin synthase
MIPNGYFVTAPGTEVGKTYVTRGLAAALTNEGKRVCAIKPMETGCSPVAADAEALARACGRPELATAPGLYRSGPPLSPYAAAIQTRTPPPSIEALCSRLNELSLEADLTLVEGAGGLLVPLDREQTMADLALALSLPLIVVACDRLGVLSHTLTAVESASARSLEVAAVVLTRHEPGPVDDRPGSNLCILAERLAAPVIAFPFCRDDDVELARAAADSGLLETIIGR